MAIVSSEKRFDTWICPLIGSVGKKMSPRSNCHWGASLRGATVVDSPKLLRFFKILSTLDKRDLEIDLRNTFIYTRCHIKRPALKVWVHSFTAKYVILIFIEESEDVRLRSEGESLECWGVCCPKAQITVYLLIKFDQLIIFFHTLCNPCKKKVGKNQIFIGFSSIKNHLKCHYFYLILIRLLDF
jgi:hypothetical protein